MVVVLVVVLAVGVVLGAAVVKFSNASVEDISE